MFVSRVFGTRILSWNFWKFFLTVVTGGNGRFVSQRVSTGDPPAVTSDLRWSATMGTHSFQLEYIVTFPLPTHCKNTMPIFFMNAYDESI